MDLDPIPAPLECAACGDPIDATGYLPATDRGDTYEPVADAAVCGACGFNDVGFAGCAPELDDVIDPGPDDVLLQVRVDDAGLEVVDAKD